MRGPAPGAAEAVAVIGGGFCGSLTAANLLRRSSRTGTRVVLIDRDGRFGPGVAYGTACDRHLLNVSASRMSAFDDEPHHFLEWARARRPTLEGTEFLPRMMYGEYLRDILGGADSSRLERVWGRAVDVEPGNGGFVVTLEDGRTVGAGAVVLALGNGPPSDPPLPDRAILDNPRYIGNPWQAGSLARIGADDRVLLIGSGLTMLDVVLELRAAGHRVTIDAVSRRGLIPAAHRPPGSAAYPPAQALAAVFWERTALGLLRALRREARSAAASGVDWREVINGLRPITAELWGSLPSRERRRFLAHLRPYWDTHRHRAASEVSHEIEGLIGEEVLWVRAGRVESLRDVGGRISAWIRRRGESEARLFEFEAVVNCIGPEADVRRWNDPLINALLRRHLGVADPLGLGLNTAPDGRLIDGSGVPVDGLMAVGALRKGTLWESTAVPEVRGQAAGISRVLGGAAARMTVG